MVNHFKFASRIGLAVLFILLMGEIGWGAEQGGTEPAGPGATSTARSAEEELPEANQPAPDHEVHTILNAFAGYRFITVNRSGGRAAEYDYLHSSPVLGGSANYLEQENKFSLEGEYLNVKDFHGELAYDHKGIYRFNLRTDSLFHNLDHERLFAPPFTLGGNATSSVDLNPADSHGVRVEQDLARFRYKFSQFPVHLNLGYWRMVKEGTAQLRFADHAFAGSPNAIFAKTRQIDQQTHEGEFGADAHLGPLDLIYEFRVREFGEHAATPRDFFIARLDPNLALQRIGGLLEHNENPDSRFYAHTVRIHTSMSGGLVGAASYTYGRRENLSSLTDFRGADQAFAISHSVAGDFTYTPSQIFSVALKYRRHDVERSGPATLANPGGMVVNPPVIVRPAIDTQQDSVTATLSYRPTKLVTIKGEYRGEFLARDQLDSWVRPGKVSTLSFPGHSVTHTGSLALLGRPAKGLKLKAEYKYSVSDAPVFATAYEERHEGSFQAFYNAPNRWGGSVGTRIAREGSDHLTITSLDSVNAPVTIQMPRDKKTANLTASLWFVPLKKLTVTGSYSLLRSSTDQAVLFASLFPQSNTLTNFTSQAQIYAVNAVYHCNDRLDLSLAVQQVRSSAEFDPRFIDIGQNRDTSGIREISRLKAVESTLASRADYRFAKYFSCALEYAFKDYDEKNAPLFNGSVNSVMLYLATKW